MRSSPPSTPASLSSRSSSLPATVIPPLTSPLSVDLCMPLMAVNPRNISFLQCIQALVWPISRPWIRPLRRWSHRSRSSRNGCRKRGMLFPKQKYDLVPIHLIVLFPSIFHPICQIFFYLRCRSSLRCLGASSGCCNTCLFTSPRECVRSLTYQIQCLHGIFYFFSFLRLALIF